MVSQDSEVVFYRFVEPSIKMSICNFLFLFSNPRNKGEVAFLLYSLVLLNCWFLLDFCNCSQKKKSSEDESWLVKECVLL